MDKEAPEYLSAEELRNRLYHSLRDRGLVDNIKSQLRNSIVTELQQTSRGQGQLTLRDLKVPEEGTLLHRASNSLIADHLRRCQYEYSLSVFLPESGISRDKVFGTPDLLQLLGISSQSRLYRKMASPKGEHHKKGFLWQLLSEVASLHANAVQDFGTQTDLIKVGPITSLDEKLVGVDDFYSSKRDDHHKVGVTAVEDRLLSFQRQLEERYRSDLQLELARMKDNEIARIRVEEKENGRREIDQLRRELERTYQNKIDSMTTRERNSIERMQKEQEMHEKEIYTQRQTILEEIEQLRRREADVKRQADINDREKQLMEDRLRDKESNLKHREHLVNRQETEYEQKLANEMTKFKVEEQAKFMARTQNLEIREAKLREDERRVGEDKDHLQGLKDTLKDREVRINELETKIQEEKHKEVSASRQNELLHGKLRDMGDYKVLQESNAVMKNELETLRTRLAELLQMNERERGRQEEMMRELRRPSPETLMLQRDLEKTKEALRQETTLSSAQTSQLEKRLQEEMDRNRDLLRRFEDQTSQMKDMNRELVDLRSQLSITHQALTNEVYRKPVRPGSDSRGGSLHTSRQVPENMEGADDVQKIPTNLSPRLDVLSPRRASRRPRFEDNDVYNDIDVEFGLLPSSGGKVYTDLSEEDLDNGSLGSADIVAEAKYRLRSLEKEALNLEKVYRNFQYQMINPVADTEPSRTPRGSHQSGPKDVTSQKKVEIVASPGESPIHRPMSSTPYQQAGRSSSQLADSLHELTGSRDREHPPPRFDISNMSDDGEHHQDERIEKPRPITVSDLEARPGSPSIMVVPGSGASSEDNIPAARDPGKASPLPPLGAAKLAPIRQESPATPNRPPPGGKLVPMSLDDAWKAPSLEDAWKSQPAVKEVASTEDDDRWEEERRKKEAERKKKEEEAWEREQRELERLQGKRGSEDFEDDHHSEQSKKEEKGVDDDGIDPTMKQYMAMVAQQKEKEMELAKKTTDTWSKGRKFSQADTPTQSEQEMSGADVHSNDGSEADFQW
ncbi:oral-facial-digital syndrome 1 protein homolog isoform X2 [Pecten maximus]|uniref:oral-facial-digital syndrome 1 protein homolog isoform X2 n=1 Tax=Pecten maximus TaxID=6579 RepID=UPI0014588974|nr:oral-facial-digital syndrome 1 protein homolog isoform X2 [Pecten maximus]